MGTFHLLDLNAEFCRYELRTATWTRVLGNPLTYKHGDPTEQVTGQQEFRIAVPTLKEAQGVLFQCPKCAVGKRYGFKDGRGFYYGAHGVLCWFRNPRTAPPVPPEADPKPGRWWISAGSTDLENLTFEHGEPSLPKSIQLVGGCNWHGYVENGIAHD